MSEEIFTTGEVMRKVADAVKALQDAQVEIVRGIKELKDHNEDENAHGLTREGSAFRESLSAELMEKMQPVKTQAFTAAKAATEAFSTATTAAQKADTAKTTSDSAIELATEAHDLAAVAKEKSENAADSSAIAKEKSEKAVPKVDSRGELAGYETAKVMNGTQTISITSPDSINLTTSGAVTLAFTPGAAAARAIKSISITASAATTLKITGATWANNGEAPGWGNAGKILVLVAHFVGGRVVLSVADNTQA